jgi:hypothetical protein
VRRTTAHDFNDSWQTTELRWLRVVVVARSTFVAAINQNAKRKIDSLLFTSSSTLR